MVERLFLIHTQDTSELGYIWDKQLMRQICRGHGSASIHTLEGAIREQAKITKQSGWNKAKAYSVATLREHAFLCDN